MKDMIDKPESTKRTEELLQNVTDQDLVSRKAAIVTLVMAKETGSLLCEELRGVIDVLNKMPSATMHCRDCRNWAQVCEMLNAHPEVIRCRDCKHKGGSACSHFADVWISDDDFCSRAERREVSSEDE